MLCAASNTIEPKAFVGRSDGGGVQWGFPARASRVRQIPPPAAAIHMRQLPGAHAGSTARAVTRPDSCVAGPVFVAGSKNCEFSPGTLGVRGPRSVQDAVAASAFRYARGAPGNALAEGLPGNARNARRLALARRSST